MVSTVEAPARPGIFANTAVNVVGIGLAHGLSALAGLITANVLGPAGVGILAVSFGLVEFGRSLSNFSHNPSILAYHRNGDAARVFGTSLTLKLLGSILFVALIGAFAPTLADLFDLPVYAVWLASSVLVLGTIYEIGSARLEADNRMVKRNVLLAGGPALGLVIVGTLALLGKLTVMTSILATMAAVLTMSLSFLADEPRLYRFRYHKETARYLLDYGARIVAASILAQGLLWTDTLMVSYLLGNAATGVYNIVFQLTYVMVTGSMAIAVALTPALSELAGRGDDTTLGYQRGTLIALAMSGALALLFLATGPLLLRLYGPEFTAGYPSLLVLLVFGVAAASAVPASTLLTVHGRAGWITLVGLAQLVVNVPLNYYLITRHGIVGAAIATTSVFVAGTLLQWWLARKATGALPLSRAVFDEARAYARLRLGGKP